MATSKQELIEIYPEVYDYDFEEELKKEKKSKKTTKKKTATAAGCPTGYHKNEFGQCLNPEINKITEKMKMLENQADMLEKAWKEAVDLSTGRIPMQGEGKRLDLIERLLDENIDDMKNIKRYLFW